MAAFKVTVRIISVFLIGKKDLSFYKARCLEQLEGSCAWLIGIFLIDEARVKLQLAGCKIMRRQLHSRPGYGAL